MRVAATQAMPVPSSSSGNEADARSPPRPLGCGRKPQQSEAAILSQTPRLPGTKNNKPVHPGVIP